MNFDPKTWDERTDQERADYIRDNTTYFYPSPPPIFSREIDAKIIEHIKRGEVLEAQRLILDELGRQISE